MENVAPRTHPPFKKKGNFLDPRKRSGSKCPPPHQFADSKLFQNPSPYLWVMLEISIKVALIVAQIGSVSINDSSTVIGPLLKRHWSTCYQLNGRDIQMINDSQPSKRHRQIECKMSPIDVSEMRNSVTISLYIHGFILKNVQKY